ncbi:type I phosphomannose isomerase catalytic subunit [Escherichia coli]
MTELYGMEKPVQPADGRSCGWAHIRKSSSRVQNAAGDIVSLRDVIESNKSTLLGEAVAKRFGELPFLFKILCAAQPLSIQVHPNKRNSEIGFAKENAAGIPMDAAERNYNNS